MPRAAVPTAAPFLPENPRSLTALRSAVQHCRGCDLYRDATQAVFGEGPKRAHVMLVGEQPGDKEDLSGHPFVSPAGALLRKAMEEASLDPADAYITNAVKHFKFIERGKRRIHQSPKVTEVRACAPWLEAELAAIRPQLVIALGATAAKALLGQDFRITADRGKLLSAPLHERIIATAHPSSILRAPDEHERRVQYAALVDDLEAAANALASAARYVGIDTV